MELNILIRRPSAETRLGIRLISEQAEQAPFVTMLNPSGVAAGSALRIGDQILLVDGQKTANSEAAVALHSAAALAAKRSCEVEQLRAAHSRSEVDQRRATARMDAAGSLVAASEQLNYVVREYAAAAAASPAAASPTRCCPHATLLRHALAPARAVAGRWAPSSLCSRPEGWRRLSR